MIDREPNVKELMDLWNVCKNFIEGQKIGFPETIYQCDWVIENAYELIGVVCNLVGYAESEDE